MAGGTRFYLWPKLEEGFTSPELVEISLAPGSISPGPQDRWMYVANAVDKSQPYKPPGEMPPYMGPEYPPAVPDRGGHFDWIPQGTPQFRAAHLYGTVRRVLDIWETLLGHRIVWWRVDAFPRLELVPTVRWGNAHSGAGFIETGRLWSHVGVPQELCLSFDAVAHEVGHSILFSVLGAPATGHLTGAFLAFHETFADLVAATSTLYFDSVAQHLLQQTNGNLYALNLVSRVGALSGSDQVRLLDNDVTLSDLGGLRLGPDGNWIDPSGIGRDAHAAAAPLSGAIWDCFVELFQDGLVRRGAIGHQLDTRGWNKARVTSALAELHAAAGAALQRFYAEFDVALRDARDVVGLALARCIQRIVADDLDIHTVAARFCESVIERWPSDILPALIENFTDRQIDPTPLLGQSSSVAYGRVRRPPSRVLGSANLVTPHPAVPTVGSCRGCGNPAAVAAVCGFIRHPYRGAAALSGL